jgi:hypothetical protein
LNPDKDMAEAGEVEDVLEFFIPRERVTRKRDRITSGCLRGAVGGYTSCGKY